MFRTFLYPIRSRLILALLIPLLPLVLAMMMYSWNNNKQQIERASGSTQDYAFIASGYQRQILSDLKQLLTILAEEPQYRSGGENCSRSLNRIAARIDTYSFISIADRTGKIVCGTGSSGGISIADRQYFQDAKQSLQFTVSDSLIGKISGKSVLVGSMPWADENGDFAGMAIASIRADRFASSFREMPLPPGSKYFLLDRKGQLIAGSGTMPEILKAKLAQLPVLTSNPTPFLIKDEDISRTYTGVTLENGALTVIIGIPRRFFLNINTGNLLVSLLGPIALLIVVIGLIWYLGNRLVTHPVTSLIKTARAYSRGDLSVRPETNIAGGELKELSTTFSEMADRITRRENELQEAIQKREMMLREIHHRVKNNLQIVISLVNLQSKSVSLPAAQEAFTEIQTRMRALALVHRYLYESEDLQSVNIGAFLMELCNSLQTAYGVSPARVSMEVKTDAVFEIIDRAVPLALFMTETISNALRHAFPENRPGYIKVTLKAMENNHACFTVDDNGIGMDAEAPAEDDGIFRSQKQLSSLGMSLAKAFARQVDGELTMSGSPGTLVSLIFKTRIMPSAQAQG